MIVLRNRRGDVIHEAPAEGFVLRDFLLAAAGTRAHAGSRPALRGGTPLPRGYKSLSGADFGDLASRLRAAGVANAFTAEGRLDMRKSDFSGWDLSSADLGGVDLTGSSLVRAVMRRTSCHAARLVGADLSGAYMEVADFGRAAMTGVRMRPAKVPDGGADIPECLLDRRHPFDNRTAFPMARGANFKGATMSGAEISQADFAGRVLRPCPPRPRERQGLGFLGGDLRRDRRERSGTVTEQAAKRLHREDADARGHHEVERVFRAHPA